MSAPTLDAEVAFVGSLLHLPARTAADALALVTPEDFGDPQVAVIADVCHRLAASGIDPDPVAVLAYARRHGVLTGVDATRAAALLIAEVYAACPVPAAWRVYAAAVLDESLRRRCTVLATRVGQCAEGGSIDALLALIGTEIAEVRAVHQRRAAEAEVAPR
jgi:replicative DNA helicase